MSKRFLKLLMCFFVVVIFVACEAGSNYSQLLKQEQNLIDDFLIRKGYVVLDEFPKDSVFGEKEMYRFPNEGIYIRLIDKGVGDTIRRGDQFSLRYKQSTLDENPIIEDYWTTMDRPYPNIITMGTITYSCEGWQKAFDVMQRSQSHAEIIVPSKLGRNIQEVTPYYYEMKIRVLPK